MVEYYKMGYWSQYLHILLLVVFWYNHWLNALFAVQYSSMFQMKLTSCTDYQKTQVRRRDPQILYYLLSYLESACSWVEVRASILDSAQANQKANYLFMQTIFLMQLFTIPNHKGQFETCTNMFQTWTSISILGTKLSFLQRASIFEIGE